MASLSQNLMGQEIKTTISTCESLKVDKVNFHKYGNHFFSTNINWGPMQFAFTAHLKKVRYGVELIQYDEQLKELKKISLDNGERNFGPFEPIFHFGDNAIYVFYFKFEEDEKIILYVSKVKPDDLSIIATKQLMQYDQKNQGVFGAIKTINESQIFYTISENGKNCWVVHSTPKLLQSCVMDGDLNIIQKAETIPIKMEKILITGGNIDNDNNKVFTYRFDNLSFPDFFERGIFFQSANSKGVFKPVKLSNGDAPGNLSLYASKKSNKLYLGGEYFGLDYSGSKGVFLSEINNATQSLSKPKFTPFAPELKQRVLDLDFATKKKGEIIINHLNFEINELGNGTIIFSTDIQKSSTASGVFNNISYTAYYSGPIIHIFIPLSGNEVMTLIPKRQMAGSFTRYFNYVYKDKLICIYSDLPKYQDKEYQDKQIGMVRTESDLVPVANIYDSDGKLLSRKMLLDSKINLKGNIMIGDLFKNGENKFFLPIGESKVNLVKYFTKINGFCNIEIL